MPKAQQQQQPTKVASFGRNGVGFGFTCPEGIRNTAKYRHNKQYDPNIEIEQRAGIRQFTADGCEFWQGQDDHDVVFRRWRPQSMGGASGIRQRWTVSGADPNERQPLLYRLLYICWWMYPFKG
jgi:hypothetical protein